MVTKGNPVTKLPRVTFTPQPVIRAGRRNTREYASLCLQGFLVFRKKDLYLVITQKLIFMKLGGFHVKSSGFHEIQQISHEIRWISCEINRHSLPTALHKTEVFVELFDL